ncbi:MAG: 1-(5-phosphoribosyl)-5-[(5-phosphoribosylamino)methylideneamino]imidazole-4-carboxamide isomerase [Bacteroidaceae bacterium]|jgi:phosphoribosylformimino-5-aminoimidazole carboxamide ribotide isomerase
MIELIPAIDIIDGKCVRLSQGDYESKKVYNENPLEVAKQFESWGIRRLHMVDLDGAASQHIVNYKVLEQVASHTSLVIDFGGGLKSDDDLRIAFECGAQMVTGGSIAVRNPEVFSGWIEQYGPDKIILGADVRDKEVAISGWKSKGGIDLNALLEKYVGGKGITKVICTDISRDGMLEGCNVELYSEILSAYPDLYLVASGGVSSMDDIRSLERASVPAVIFGKALYEGRISQKEIQDFISSNLC